MKIYKILKLISLNLIIFSCTQVSESKSDVNIFINQWIEVKYKSDTNITGEFYSRQFIFDKSTDETFNARIYSIDQELVSRYNNMTGLVTPLNPSGSEYDISEFRYSIKNDTLVLDTDSSSQSSTKLYMLNSDTLVVQFHITGSYYWDTNYEYLVRYKGDLPPDSWKSPIVKDNYEPDDDSYQNATYLTVGRESSYHTITDNDEDWFQFEGEQDKTYQISILGHMDNEIWLYKYENGNLIGSIARDYIDTHYIANGLTNVAALIVWKAEKLEQFRFFVRGWYHTEGYYKVLITETDMEPPAYE